MSPANSGGGGEPHGQRIALFVTALLVVVLTFLASGGDPDQSSAVRPSSVLLGSGGAKALFDVATLLGLAPTRWMKPLTALAGEEPRGVMVILESEDPLAEDEVAELLRFVDGGGSVVYAPPPTDPFLLMRGVRPPDRLLSALGLDDDEGHPPLVANQPGELFAPPDDVSELGGRLLADVDLPAHGFQRAFAFKADRRDDPARGILEPLLVAPHDEIKDSDGSVRVGVALVARQGGSLLLLSDASDLTNGAIRHSPLAPLVLRAFAALRGPGDGPLRFDEFHHGFDESGGLLTATWRWLTTARIGHAVIAAALAGLLALGAAALRFGAPIPRPPRERRSALEHVEALARAWHRNRALRRPRELLVEGLRMRLGSTTELARLAPLAELAVRSDDPVALAREVDRVLMELRPPTGPTPRPTLHPISPTTSQLTSQPNLESTGGGTS